MFLWTLALVVVPSALYFYFTRTFDYWKRRNVVSRKPIPLFGNIYQSAMRKLNLSDIMRNIYDDFPEEKVVGVYRMTSPALLIRDLDIIKQVMIKDFETFIDRGVEFSKEGLGANLFHADGETWKILRSKFTPIFTTGKLKNMLHLMVERGDNFIEYVNIETAKMPEHNVQILLQKFFITTISACAFGLNLDSTDSELETLDKIDKAIFTRNFMTEVDMMFPGLLKTLGSSLFSNYIKEFFYSLVSRVMKQRNNKPSNRKDFMDLILELKQQGNIQGPKRDNQEQQNQLEITESVIAAQAFVFYAAGYETSNTTLTFMLYELAKNPEIQKNLQAEIDRILAKYNGEVTYEALQEMEYLEKVFSETLRKYPIVDPLQRVAHERYKIPGTDLVIEKGMILQISVMGIHRDEKIWPNPDVFDPERFSPENMGNRHPCAFLAFGTGPRNCIGMRFSKVSSRVCLVKLLSKFIVQPSKNTQKTIKYNPLRAVTSPIGGVLLNVIPRTRRIEDWKHKHV